MTVRFKIAVTIFVIGLLTMAGVIATVALAFDRLERETTFARANVFLGRVVANYDNLLDLHDRYPDELNAVLRNLLLFEADSQLYLLDESGVVLSSTGNAKLPPGFKVAIAPVREAAQGSQPDHAMPYVLGDDPERMDASAVVAARALRRAVIRPTATPPGYLYLVVHQEAAPQGRLAVFRSAFGGPALAAVATVLALATVLAAWIIGVVIRPLRSISAEVARAAQEGLGTLEIALSNPAFSAPAAAQSAGRKPDEFDQLRTGFRTMMATLRQQWQTLRELDHFRREGVSNLSHDLRSPLTATVACLETLDHRWASRAASPDLAEDRRLVAMALRNTHNAAQLVRSLGDLAQLDEPEYTVHPQLMDLGEMVDDVALRFAQRAAQQGVVLRCQLDEHAQAPYANVDVELLERALANVVDNALKFTPSGGHITLAARRMQVGPDQKPVIELSVADSGAGIAPKDIAHLFDRFYQARDSVAPAGGEGGKGLGLAIVKRIAELHHGSVSVHSGLGSVTRVVLTVPAH
jgi:signal transduction histidine kinase